MDALEWRQVDEGVGTGVLGEGHSKSGGQKTWPREGKGKVRKEAEHTKHRGEAETGQPVQQSQRSCSSLISCTKHIIIKTPQQAGKEVLHVSPTCLEMLSLGQRQPVMEPGS